MYFRQEYRRDCIHASPPSDPNNVTAQDCEKPLSKWQIDRCVFVSISHPGLAQQTIGSE